MLADRPCTDFIQFYSQPMGSPAHIWRSQLGCLGHVRDMFLSHACLGVETNEVCDVVSLIFFAISSIEAFMPREVGRQIGLVTHYSRQKRWRQCARIYRSSKMRHAHTILIAPAHSITESRSIVKR